MRVTARVIATTEESETGYEHDAVYARCTRCGTQSETSFGTGERSVKRCLLLLRQRCPRKERNFYVQHDEKFEREMETAYVEMMRRKLCAHC